MFTGFVEPVVNLLAEVAATFPLGADADPAQSSHPLMVLAEPSTLSLAIMGAAVLAVGHRIRRSQQRVARTSQQQHSTAESRKDAERPRRGAA